MSQRSDRDSVLVSTLLVKPGELAAELAQDRPPVLLDVRWRLAGPPGIDSYRQGHLPGAVFADLDRDLAAPPGPAGRHPLPEPAVFQAAMPAAGGRCATSATRTSACSTAATGPGPGPASRSVRTSPPRRPAISPPSLAR